MRTVDKTWKIHVIFFDAFSASLRFSISINSEWKTNKTNNARFKNDVISIVWRDIKAAATEPDGMTPRNAAGARDSVSADQKSVVQQLLSFPQPFTITRPKLYNPLPSKSPIQPGSSKLSFYFFFFS